MIMAPAIDYSGVIIFVACLIAITLMVIAVAAVELFKWKIIDKLIRDGLIDSCPKSIEHVTDLLKYMFRNR